MKKNLILILMSCCVVFTGYTQNNEINKQHHFGFGISSVLSSSTNPHLKYLSDGYNGFFGKIDKNMDLLLAGRYEYTLNKQMFLGTGLTYRFNRTELALDYGAGSIGETNYSMHDLEIPLYFDYKYNILPYTNLFTGIGMSGVIKLSSDSDLIDKDTFSPYLLLRTGFELATNHRIQFLFQYRINLSNSVEYKLSIPYPYKTEFRTNTFDVGINFFF